MPDVVYAQKTVLKIFVASSAEVKNERDECVQILNKLENAHQYIFIKPVLWEFDMPHSNYPGHTNIQDAINQSTLNDCPVVVFIFYSKIGKYTREEFDFAVANNKRVFVYFKEGFSPAIENIEAYSELLKFQQSLNDFVLYEKYKDLTDFKGLLYTNLNLYLAQTYLPVAAQAGTQQDIIVKLKEAEKARKELEQQLATQTQNSVLKALAQQEIKKGDYEAAKEHLKQSAKNSIEDTSSTFYELGKISKLQLLYQDAFNYFELAAKIDPQNDDYLDNTGRMANLLGYYDTAMEYHQKCLAVRISVNGDQHEKTAYGYSCVGSAYCSKGEYTEAIKYYNKALVILRKLLGDEHFETVVTYINLAEMHRRIGIYGKAIEYLVKAVAVGGKSLGVMDVSMGIWHGNLGKVYNDMYKFDKAIKSYERAITIFKENYPNDHPYLATAYVDLAFTLVKISEYDKAIDYIQKALTIYNKFFPLTHPHIQNTQNALNHFLTEKEQSLK